MGDIRRVRAVWSGLPGSPYLSTFYFFYDIDGVAGINTAVQNFLIAVCNHVSPGLSVIRENEHMILDEVDGHLVGTETAGTATAISGAGGTEPLPPQCQGVLKMTTAGIVNNRRVRGRFFAPAVPEVQSNGAPLATYMTNLTTAGTTLISASNIPGFWGVWSRPLTASEIPAGSSLTPRTGSFHRITACAAWSKFGVQRRRRD